MARYHYRLGQLEKLTFFKSIKDFTALGISDRRLFINSVPSQNLKDEEWEELTTLYGKKLENIVVEFTEYERASYNAMQYKLKRIRDCGAYVALDDYGTGYNGEAILLECFPDFVKIDILLVRNVDKDAERQKMISQPRRICQSAKNALYCGGRGDERGAGNGHSSRLRLRPGLLRGPSRQSAARHSGEAADGNQSILSKISFEKIERRDGMPRRGFLYIENPAIVAGFKKG